MRTSFGVCAVVALLSGGASARQKQPAKTKPGAKAATKFTPVRGHIQKGRYGEALEALDALEKAKADAVEIAVHRSRCFTEQGKWKQAADTLQAAIKKSPRNAALHARLAEVQFALGRYKEAEQTANKAIKLDGNQPRAHLVLADVYTETGRIKQALKGYRWFVRYYNRVQPTDADTLILVARGSLQYARWKSVSGIFNFVINTLCPDALKDDENCWQAHYISGALLLEKYNRAQALPDLEKALAVNPNAVDALVELGYAADDKNQTEKATEYAQKALKVVPNHVPALQLKADVLLGLGRIDDAVATLKQALAVNPHDQRTLARLAACDLLADGPPSAKDLTDLLANVDAVKNLNVKSPDRFTKLVIALAKRNPRPGYFFSVLGKRIEERRKFDLAERFYKTATRVMPELAEPKTALGMLYMRTGRTKLAKTILDTAFKADPFHVRVSNMRKVLKLLDGYATISTPHFVIRVDSKADKILGRYMAEYLEEIYPELTKQFGFEPPARTHFEIYQNGNGQTGQEWFAARLIGLPWIHTIGASTGMMVALTSPTAGKPFNWARVLKHEYVHIITLQQTKFNIPHWFTEALAVTAEGFPRTETWDRLLLERVPKGDLRTLANLNEGFIRPRNSLDWQFAYCQSRLYAQYMAEKYGKESIPKLLEAYRKNLPTPKGIQAATGVDIATFEKGYLDYLRNLVKGLKAGEPAADKTLAELKQAYEADTTNARAAGEYAYGLLKAGMRTEAGAIAAKANSKDPKEPLAAVVIARLAMLAEKPAAALKTLEAAYDKSKPNLQVVLLLAQLKLADEKNGEAADLLELGRKHFPHSEPLLIALAKIYLKLDETDKLKPLLEVAAARNFDDTSVRKKLTEISLAQKNYKDVVKYGMQVLYIDVLDVATHGQLGEAFRELKDYKKSVREFTVALQLKPGDSALQVELAKTHVADGDKDKAKTLLDEVLKNDPDNAAAKALRAKL